jgi:DNA-binding MarR family transcriptional regulator
MSIVLYRNGVAQDPPELTSSTGYLLARMGAVSRQMWARMLAEHELTPHHFGVLMTLDQAGAASHQQLSRAAGIDPRNAVPVIDKLAQRGLVRRQPDPTDRRRNTVTLTNAGRTTLKDLCRGGERVERQLLDCLTGPERARLHQVLLKLLTAVRD